MRAPLLSLFVVVGASAALAEDIPELDSNAHCERVAGDAGGDTAMRRCLWVEEYARSELDTFGRARGLIFGEGALSRMTKKVMRSWRGAYCACGALDSRAAKRWS